MKVVYSNFKVNEPIKPIKPLSSYYLINLKSRPDRLEYALKQLKKHGIHRKKGE